MNLKRNILFSLLLIVSAVYADPIPYKDCGSKGGEISVQTFDVSGCSKFPCMFHKNTNATLTVKFTASKF